MYGVCVVKAEMYARMCNVTCWIAFIWGSLGWWQECQGGFGGVDSISDPRVQYTHTYSMHINTCIFIYALMSINYNFLIQLGLCFFLFFVNSFSHLQGCLFFHMIFMNNVKFDSTFKRCLSSKPTVSSYSLACGSAERFRMSHTDSGELWRTARPLSKPEFIVNACNTVIHHNACMRLFKNQNNLFAGSS